ncbi:protein transport protein SEC31-like protein [Skeletonema marinoi]|uniref:Protein transport protein SEC31-like protein n=1 Tax=Skeletonema marinoi TaxID=267567 RepID=A0AAD9DA72_9STRA|nr:protein transport protein SEC31-like protein [Skeletonema marinoi]
MTLITQIEDKGAVVAWSPIGEYADVIALGSKEKGGIGFDDYGGELELYDLNITKEGSNNSPTLLGSLKTSTRFGSIAWSTASASSGIDGSNVTSSGILAGGLLDGTVNLWKPSSIMNDLPDATLASVTLPNNNDNNTNSNSSAAVVSTLKFNPHPDSRHLLATGTSSGHVYMMDCTTPTESTNIYSPGGEGTKSQGGEITQVSWNSQVSHILASSCANGTVVVWDTRQKKPWCELRCEANCPVSDMKWNPTQGMPLTTLEGHAGGVLSMDWCPHDETLLVSCGNDNRTLLWDLYSLQPIAEVPNEDVTYGNASDPSSIYGGGLSSSQQKRNDVQWSPLRRGVISTCSFDRKIQAHSVVGLATKCGRPPKWMSPGSGVSCGFGGVVVSIEAQQKVVKIDTIVEHPELVEASEKFESEFAATDCITYCHTMAERAEDDYESQVWSFMQIMFETDAREQLLNYLGFDPEKINQAAMEFNEDGSNPSDAEPIPAMSKDAENAVKDALLVGNFEAAVECCFRSGNYADALVLASCGGAELWAKTQAEYFHERQSDRSDSWAVDRACGRSDPKKWRETLAVLSTYGQSEEFPSLCAALGDRLEESGDTANASLCYMCALDLGQAVKYWKITLEDAGTSLLSLQDFVEKVSVFTQALDCSHDLDDEVSNLFADYSKALANQGDLVSAAKYLKGDTKDTKELRDRIYRSRFGSFCPDLMASPPDFPYNYVNVGVARDLHGITLKQPVAQTQQYQEQQQPQQQEQQTIHENQSFPSQANAQVQQPQQQQQQQETQQSSSGLPNGWVALQDPSSGRTYYANQNTGESSWDPPVAASPALAPQPEPTYAQPSASPTDSSQLQLTRCSNHRTMELSMGRLQFLLLKKLLASMEMDSLPRHLIRSLLNNTETLEQAIHTQCQSTWDAAAAVGGQQMKKAPVSGTLDSMPTLSEDYAHLQSGLLAIVEQLHASAVGGMEKKQAMESQKAVAVFIKTLARGGIDSDVANQVTTMLSALQNRDYGSASAVVTRLISNEWKDHKDWLKGMKFLVQMVSKKQL